MSVVALGYRISHVLVYVHVKHWQLCAILLHIAIPVCHPIAFIILYSVSRIRR